MPIKKLGKGFNFPKKENEFRKLQLILPRIIANNSLNHFLKGFRNGGGQTDAGRWKNRKRADKRTRSILVNTGALRRDIRVRRTTLKSIIIGTQSIVYARRHNEGLTDSRGRGMPKREFLGDSKVLDKVNINIILKSIDKIMK